MKHPYKADCDCPRCTKERARRALQGTNSPRRADFIRRTGKARKPAETRRPVVGSAEWAETRGDDIDSDSGDY